MLYELRYREVLGSVILLILIMGCFAVLHIELFSLYAKIALPLSFLLVLIYLILIGGQLNIKKMFCYVLFVTSLITFATINGESNIGSVIVLCISVFTFIEISDAEFNDVILLYFRKMLVVAEVLLFASSLAFKQDWIYSRAHNTNPNTIGFYFLLIPITYHLFSKESNRKNTILFIGMIIISVCGMINCMSRMTTVALGLYFIFTCIPSKFLSKIYKGVIFLVVACGIALPFVYIHLYEIGYKARMFGKSLYTGREYLWTFAIEQLNSSNVTLWFGAGSGTANGMNLHNNYLSMLFNFGILGFSMYYLFYIVLFVKCSNFTSDFVVKRGLAMFFSVVLVLSLTETTTLWAPMFIWANLGLGVAYRRCFLVQKVYQI